MIHIAVTKADKPCSAVCAEQLNALHSVQVSHTVAIHKSAPADEAKLTRTRQLPLLQDICQGSDIRTVGLYDMSSVSTHDTTRTITCTLLDK